MCKDFSDDMLSESLGKQGQADFLAKTVDYFKENDDMSYEDFKYELFEDKEHKDMFEDYKRNYESLNDVLIRNNFEISGAVLKKEKGKLKTEIKLDTNIQIKLDIDAPDAASEYLERGYSEEKKMKFYKVYFNEEK